MISPHRRAGRQFYPADSSLTAGNLAAERIVRQDVSTIHRPFRFLLGDGIVIDNLRVDVDVIAEVGREHTIATASASRRVHADP